MRPSLRIRAGLVLALALPLAALAAEGDASSPSFGEEVVVQGVRRPGAAADPTAAATVIDTGRFAGEAKTVAELIATSPGVAVSQYGGLGQLATVSIRGASAAQVEVFLDGVPLNTAAGGGVDLSRIPRAWIERIEVVRGSEGAVYGVGALGGAVNIVTRRAVAGAWSAEASAGSFDTLAGSADLSIGGSGWSLLGAAAIDYTGGRFTYLFDPRPALEGDTPVERERAHNASFVGGGLAKLGAAIGEGQLEAVLQLSGGRRDLPGSPYHLTPDDAQRDARVALLTRFSRPLAGGLDLIVAVSARHDRLDVEVAPDPPARERDLQASGSAELAWTRGGSSLSLRAEAGGERLDVDGAPGHARGTFALTLAEDLALGGDRVRLTPVLRWDLQGPFQGVSAKLGGSVRLAGPLSLRAGVGRSFRIPSFAELYLSQGALAPNPELLPESSWSVDASLVAEGPLGLAAVTGFAQLYRDLIVYEPDSFRRLKPFNDGKAAARGIEVEVASTPAGPARLSASAAYTWLATETLRGDEAVLGKDLPHRARHRLFARLGVAPGPFAAHAEVQYVSSQYQDRRNSPGLLVPAAFTVQGGASLRVWRSPDAHVGLEIRNVLDDRSLQDGFGNPLPGRMVMLTARVAGGKDSP